MANSNVWGWQERIRIPCMRKCKKGVPSGNACYLSVHDISSFRLLPKNIKVIIHRTIIFSVVFFHGCDTWSLILREEGTLTPEIVCWGRYLGLRRWKCQETGENCIFKIFVIRIPHQLLLGWSYQEDEIFGACGAFVEERNAYRNACVVLAEKSEG
jgi:hypothetical protein